MRVLITGAAGFIGSHLGDALLADRHEVVGVDNLTTGLRENVPERMDFIEADICDLPDLGRFDAIYHCAASYADRDDWERDARTNVLGTIAVTRLAKASDARLVYFQTSLCYGPNPESPVPTDAPLDPHGSYAVSKTAGERYIRDAKVDWVSLRLANMYGPRNLSGPVPTFYSRLSKGEAVTITDGRRDYVYVGDLIRLAVHALARGRGIYHAATGTDRPTLDVYRAVVAAMGLDLPEPEVIPRAADDVATLLLDPIDTLTEFGWSARTPLVAGIHEAVAWYRRNPPAQTFTHLAPAPARG